MSEYGAINYPENMPSHVAVIMDGNGRWAKKEACRALSGIRLEWNQSAGW